MCENLISNSQFFVNSRFYTLKFKLDYFYSVSWHEYVEFNYTFANIPIFVEIAAAIPFSINNSEVKSYNVRNI